MGIGLKRRTCATLPPLTAAQIILDGRCMDTNTGAEQRSYVRARPEYPEVNPEYPGNSGVSGSKPGISRFKVTPKEQNEVETHFSTRFVTGKRSTFALHYDRPDTIMIDLDRHNPNLDRFNLSTMDSTSQLGALIKNIILHIFH